MATSHSVSTLHFLCYYLISSLNVSFCSLEPFWIWQRQKNNNLEIDWSFSWNFISFAKAKPKQIKNCEICSCSDLNAKLNSALKFTKAVQNYDQTYLYELIKSILNCNTWVLISFSNFIFTSASWKHKWNYLLKNCDIMKLRAHFSQSAPRGRATLLTSSWAVGLLLPTSLSSGLTSLLSADRIQTYLSLHHSSIQKVQITELQSVCHGSWRDTLLC